MEREDVTNTYRSLSSAITTSTEGAGRLRYRGLRHVRYSIKLKAAGLNIFRAAAALAARIQKGLLSASFDGSAFVRELRLALRVLIHTFLSMLQASATLALTSSRGQMAGIRRLILQGHQDFLGNMESGLHILFWLKAFEIASEVFGRNGSIS